jgi:mRNA-degrading endonuclease HigB of HigAB toxin-antitoxin module
MDIIGRHFLPDFWQRHPESESALRGVAAIIAAATWRDDNDIRRHLGTAVTPMGEGRMILADPDGRFELTLRVSFPRQLIHILAIREASHE